MHILNSIIKRMQNNVQQYHSMQGTNKCKKETNVGFTITQVRILGLQKHKSGWGSRYPGHGILTPPCIPDTLCD